MDITATLDECEHLIESVDLYQVVSIQAWEFARDQLIRLSRLELGRETDRYLYLLIEFTTAGLIARPDLMVAAANGGSEFAQETVLGFYAWMKRDLDGALDHFSKVDGIAPTSDRGALNVGFRARILHELGQMDHALELIDEALAMPCEYDTRIRHEVVRHGISGGVNADRGTVQGYLDIDRTRLRARHRIITLYNLAAMMSPSTTQRITITNEAHQLALASGVPWLRWTTGRAVAGSRRFSGDLTGALDVLDSIEHPKMSWGSFDSQQYIYTDSGMLLMHAGRFDEAQRKFGLAVDTCEKTDDLVSLSNNLALRAVIWFYQGKIEIADVALSKCTVHNGFGSAVNAAIQIVVGAALNDPARVEAHSKIVHERWYVGGSAPGQTFALAFKGALTRDTTHIDAAREKSVLLQPTFAAVVDACEWIAKRPAMPPWPSNQPPAELLSGTVFGVIVAGWVRHILRSQQEAIQEIEPGLYIINGETVDLRRRRALRKIVDSMRDNPGISYDVIDLFTIGWGDGKLPTTVSERVYFAIYELRRLGFKDFIETADEGYVWSNETDDS